MPYTENDHIALDHCVDYAVIPNTILVQSRKLAFQHWVLLRILRE